MAIPFWDPVKLAADANEVSLYAPDPWDTVVIGGLQLPGVCTVKGEPTLAFDKKKAGGIDGATITVNGYLPGPITIECLLWTPEQLAKMDEISPLLWTKANKKSTAKQLAKTIVNPAFALWGIASVVVLGVSVPEKGPVWGTRVVRIKCVEYVETKPTKKTATAKGAGKVPLAKELNPARNQAGDPPSKTDINPAGAAKTRKGGTS